MAGAHLVVRTGWPDWQHRAAYLRWCYVNRHILKIDRRGVPTRSRPSEEITRQSRCLIWMLGSGEEWAADLHGTTAGVLVQRLTPDRYTWCVWGGGEGGDVHHNAAAPIGWDGG